ncbi:hypothetical protein Tco_0537109 [Tanacetum coccineum]
MEALKFADSHNMVAYLDKSMENVDFDEIVDFLNANPIRYALTVSPTIYVFYIEQFWSTVKTKTVNNETQIRAKVEGKTIVITESSVRRDLQFNDEDAVFNDEYDTPSHTKKVFANMRRQGKDFSGTVTPLFATMLIQSQAVEGEGSGQPTEPQHTPTTASPSHVEPIPTIASSSHPKKTHKRRKTKRKATKISQSSGPTTLVADETVHEERGDSMERAATTAISLDAEQGSGNCGGQLVNTLGSGEDSMKLNELMEICTKLSESQKVGKEEKVKNFTTQEEGRYGHDIEINTASTSITTTSINITTAEPVITASAPIATACVSVSTTEPTRIDADAQLAERLQAEEREQMSVEEQARLLMELIIARKKFFAAKIRDESKGNKHPTNKQKQRSEKYKNAVSKKRAGKRPSKESAKRQKIEDDAEKAELKACLEIVLGDDSAIIRDDGSTKYYKIFSAMLDDFDRQDMLDLYRLVKERFESTSPEGYDRLLWGDLITLFEPSEKDEIRKAQQTTH